MLAIGAGAVLLIVVLVRIFRRKLPGLIESARQGGAILARPGQYLVRVFLPSFGAWLAKLGVIAVFLAGYGIAVTFHTVMSVMGGNSIANMVSVTPGGVGVNQAANVAALGGETDAATATAYSLGQQLAVTAWNIAFAVALVVWAFGWAGGRELVEQSYADAKVKVAEQKAQRAAAQAAKRRAAVGRATPFAGRAFRRRRPYSRPEIRATEREQTQMADNATQRSGWITFAGVMAVLAGGYNALSGIAALSDDDAIASQAKEVLYGIDLTAWGWFWLLVGLAQIVTGVLIFQRSTWGLWLGVGFAGLSAMLTVIVMFVFPLWAIAVLTIDFLVLFGLLTQSDEFLE